MAHARRTKLILTVTAAAWLVAPGTPALAAAACAPADPVDRVTLTPATYFANARFGAVSATADLNGDRFADLAVGAPGDAVGALATFRDQNNVQVVLTLQNGNRTALAARGAVHSFTEGALPKAGK